MLYSIKVLLVTFLVCFGISEVYLRYVGLYARPQINFPFNREINATPFRSLVFRQGVADSTLITNDFKDETNKFYIFLTTADKDYCTKNIPSITGRIFYKVNNEVIFDCHPNHDKYGRRITKNHPTEPVDNHTIFLGGSRTYGWGIEDFETVPSRFQKLNPETFVYNYAIPSNGIQMFIRQFEVENIAKVIPQKKGNIIYVLDHAHLRRFFATTDQIWTLHGPNYQFNEQNQLIYAGSYWETDFFKSTLYYFLSMSAFFQKLKVQLPIALDDSNYELVAKGLAKLKEVVMKQFPESIFRIITFSAEEGIQSVNTYLKRDQLEIETLKIEEFGTWASEDFFKYHYKYDTHPKANATPLMAQKITELLKK